jgi:hypothetical protein
MLERHIGSGSMTSEERIKIEDMRAYFPRGLPIFLVIIGGTLALIHIFIASSSIGDIQVQNYALIFLLLAMFGTAFTVMLVPLHEAMRFPSFYKPQRGLILDEWVRAIAGVVMAFVLGLGGLLILKSFMGVGQQTVWGIPMSVDEGLQHDLQFAVVFEELVFRFAIPAFLFTTTLVGSGSAFMKWCFACVYSNVLFTFLHFTAYSASGALLVGAFFGGMLQSLAYTFGAKFAGDEWGFAFIGICIGHVAWNLYVLSLV